jgi:hypothetical protein
MYSTNRISWIHNQEISTSNCNADSSDILKNVGYHNMVVMQYVHVMTMCTLLVMNQHSAPSGHSTYYVPTEESASLAFLHPRWNLLMSQSHNHLHGWCKVHYVHWNCSWAVAYWMLCPKWQFYFGQLWILIQSEKQSTVLTFYIWAMHSRCVPNTKWN